MPTPRATSPVSGSAPLLHTGQNTVSMLPSPELAVLTGPGLLSWPLAFLLGWWLVIWFDLAHQLAGQGAGMQTRTQLCQETWSALYSFLPLPAYPPSLPNVSLLSCDCNCACFGLLLAYAVSIAKNSCPCLDLSCSLCSSYLPYNVVPLGREYRGVACMTMHMTGLTVANYCSASL